jgi:hypothetical protein
VTLRPEDEAPRPDGGPGFSDAVTFAFGDPHEDVFGLARVGTSAEGDSALAVLFHGEDVAAATAERDSHTVRATVDEPLRSWSVAYGEHFALTFTALSLGAEMTPAAPPAALASIAGYEHLCAVAGTVRAGGREHRVRCLGQRSRQWGAPDWQRLELARSIGAWLGHDFGVTLTAVRPAGARGQDEEAVSAWLFEGRDPAVPVGVAEPRMSSTADGEGHQRRAGLELWTGDDEGLPLRAAGEVRCGTTLELGRLRLDCSFFDWRLEGREGVGRYDVLRRVA